MADFEQQLEEGAFESEGEEASEESSALDRIDETAERLVRRGIETFHGLAEVIGGVLYGEVGGHYDTLSNFEELGGRNHQRVVERLDDVRSRCKAIASQLSRMYDIEKSAARRRAELDRRSG